jgi:DNA-directed RNA polymerase beta subunit
MPRQGRKKQGGLRLGEMETDQLISCGQSSIINDFAMNYSDGCKVNICECGRIADFNPD